MEHDRDYRQKIVVAWASRVFGVDSATSIDEGTLRFGEEAIELLQAQEVPKERVLQLVEYVYARTAGEPCQEIGGCQVTLLALCQALGQSAEELERREILRCIAKDPAHFKERNEEKKRDGVTTLVQGLPLDSWIEKQVKNNQGLIFGTITGSTMSSL